MAGRIFLGLIALFFAWQFISWAWDMRPSVMGKGWRRWAGDLVIPFAGFGFISLLFAWAAVASRG